MKEMLMGACLMMTALMSLTGCATIVSGTTQKLNVTTQPAGATATADNNLSAQTPTVFTLERKTDHTIEIAKDGYKSVQVIIKRTFNGMATGNILLGGIIGTGIDAASGATSKLIPERVDLILEPGSGLADKPQFLQAKDQSFYEKSILNAGTKDNKSPAPEANAVAVPTRSATTNFGPAKASR